MLHVRDKEVERLLAAFRLVLLQPLVTPCTGLLSHRTPSRMRQDLRR